MMNSNGDAQKQQLKKNLSKDSQKAASVTKNAGGMKNCGAEDII